VDTPSIRIFLYNHLSLVFTEWDTILQNSQIFGRQIILAKYRNMQLYLETDIRALIIPVEMSHNSISNSNYNGKIVSHNSIIVYSVWESLD